MKLAYMVFWLSLSFMVSPANAVEAFKTTEAEYKMLPVWCEIKNKDGSRFQREWADRLGGAGNALHLHHYCDCLRFQSRALNSRDKYDREHYLKVAVGGCDYVLAKATPDFFMRAEIMTAKAKALLLMGQDPAALGELIKAIAFDPKFANAYIVLSDYYANKGNKSKALEHVSEGLRYNPDTKSLQRRYVELGGKLPYPNPIRPAQVEPQQVVKPAETPVAKVADDAPVDADTSVSGASPEPATQPKIGSPKNPYCRFCPD